MGRKLRSVVFLFLAFAVSSCSVIRKSPKTAFVDGFYTQKLANMRDKVYVDIDDEEESLRIHPTTLYDGTSRVDTTKMYNNFPEKLKYNVKNAISFSKYTLDVDFLTMPLKYRPSRNGIPSQLNATINGSVYLGFRTDKYNVTYEVDPLGMSDRVINHYGFSFGTFVGIGNTAMTPTTTNNYLTTEYDGIIWSKGLAGIIAVNNVTVGVSVGFDNLFDNNRNYWLYEAKPWFGLAFGLNLN